MKITSTHTYQKMYCNTSDQTVESKSNALITMFSTPVTNKYVNNVKKNGEEFNMTGKFLSNADKLPNTLTHHKFTCPVSNICAYAYVSVEVM